MPKRIYPLPPIERFHQGAVWSVTLEPVLHRRAARSWAEAQEGPPKNRDHIVVVISPTGRRWANPRWGGWWRSRLVVGDPLLRAQEAILATFRTLLHQDPLVQRNWHQDLSGGRYARLSWHLVWQAEIAVLL